MTTLTAYADAADGVISSTSLVDYATMQAGSGLVATTNVGTDGIQAGQNFSTPTYSSHQSYISFDTSSIPDTATITSATLSLYLDTDNSTGDFTVEARIYDWGATLTTADYRTGVQAAALTLVATLASSGIGATGAYKAFTDVAMVANVNKTGTTYIGLYSDKFSSVTAPTVLERLQFSGADYTGTTRDPKLVVVYDTEAAVGQATETDLAQAISAARAVTIGQPSETDLAQAIAVAKGRDVGQATETDFASITTPSTTPVDNPSWPTNHQLQAAPANHTLTAALPDHNLQAAPERQG